MENEIWKPVVGFEGIYSVSSIGRIRGEIFSANNKYKPGRILKPYPTKKGYLHVPLSKDRTVKYFYISTLVATAFLGPKPDGLEINHKDGIKTNDYPNNLEYVTHSENLLHAHRNGLYKKPFAQIGIKNGMAKLSEEDVKNIRKIWSKGETSLAELSYKYGIAVNNISRICLKKSWKHI